MIRSNYPILPYTLAENTIAYHADIYNWCFTDKPITPNITSLPNSTTDRMSWSHNPGCYRHHNFMFNLGWTRTGDSLDSPSSGSITTTATQYDFSSLPRGEYSVSIRAQSMENTSIESDVTRARINLTRKLVYMSLFGLS